MGKITLKDMITTPMHLKTYEEETVKQNVQKKIGRPKGRKRDQVVVIYLSNSEKETLQENADKMGLGLTQYARLKIFQD